VPDISDIIQAIARQRGRGDSGPLNMLRQLDGAPGERISHLPIDAALAQAWVALTGEPFRPHQAQALTALRRGEPVALAADSADVAMSAYLLLYATLLAEPGAAALLLAPDDGRARNARAELAQLNDALPQSLRLSATLLAGDRRPDHYARVVVATPEALHGRLLRHHDRAWSLFWPRLRLVALPEIHRHTGVAGAHLADLLLRAQRVAAAHSGDARLATLAAMLRCEAPDAALGALLGQPWRIIAADDGPYEPAWLAVWRGAGRLREAADLAHAIRRQGYHAHIVCEPLESTLLAPIVGDTEGLSWGPIAPPAQVLIAAGYHSPYSTVRRMLRSGHQAVILVLGDLPHEQALARQTEQLLSGPPPAWPAPSPNAYATAQHILCAASELPLTEAEVDSWGAQDIVARLAKQGHLVDLPDAEVAWKPTDAAGDPYAEFSILASSGSAITARGEQGQLLATLDPTCFERWTFPNAALPPGAGGFRVVARDENGGSLTLRLENNGRRTYPLRRCEMDLREERETRPLAGGRQIGWGRVVVDEQIYGYREAAASANSAPSDLALQPPLTARWAAPACWFDVNISAQVLGQFVGWSLAAALQLRALAAFTDIVPCYDHAARRLYLVDAQPGGSGLAAWIYAHAEELLPLAYDVALACRNDALLEPLSRADMDWLLALLGRVPEPAPAEPVHAPGPARPARPSQPIRPELIEGPPPATPRVVLTPAPAESPRPADNGSAAVSREARRTQDEERRSKPPSMPSPDTRRSPRDAAPPAPPAPARRAEPPPPERRQGELPLGRDQPAAERTQDQRAAPRAREPEHPPAERPSNRVPSQAPPARHPPAERSAPKAAEPRRPEPPAERPSNRAQPHTPPPRQAAPAPLAPEPRKPDARADQASGETQPDADALIARLRRQREQREGHKSAQPPRRQQSSEIGDVQQRFAAGERIFCLPYGDGVVQESRAENGREILTVNFMNHGDLTIDPAVNVVRKLEDAPEEDDLL
jgi:hypothetical protein